MYNKVIRAIGTYVLPVFLLTNWAGMFIFASVKRIGGRLGDHSPHWIVDTVAPSLEAGVSSLSECGRLIHTVEKGQIYYG